MKQRTRIRTCNGAYVSAENGGVGVVMCIGTRPFENETFTLVPIDENATMIQHNDQVNLVTWRNTKVELAEDSSLKAGLTKAVSVLEQKHQPSQQVPGPYTTNLVPPKALEPQIPVIFKLYKEPGKKALADVFRIVMVPGESGVLKPLTRFGLLAANGKFLSAENGGGGALVAKSTAMREWETFTAEFSVPIAEPQGNQGKLNVSLREKPEPASRTEGNEADISPEADFVCMTRPVTITESYSEGMLLDPLSDVVWPSSLVDGARWVNGEYRPITDLRAPITVSLSLQNFIGASASINVQNPSLSAMRNALNSLRRANQGVTLDARIQAEITEVHSREQLQVAMSGSFDTGVYKLASQFNFSENTANNKVILKYLQVYFTVDVDLPPTGADLFASKRSPSPNEMIISSVTYGRMLLLTVESKESMDDLKAAVQFAYKPYNVDAQTSMQYNRTFSESKKSLLVLGGPAALAEPIVLAGGLQEVLGAIDTFIKSGNKYDENTAAVPLSYRMRFLQSFGVGNICLITSFTERRCVKATGRIRITDIRFKAVKVSDPGDDIELYGKLWIGADIDGGGTVDWSLPTDLVWDHDSDSYVSIPEGKEAPVNTAPSFTFHDFHKVKDRAYVVVNAHLLDQDKPGKDDHINGDEKRFYVTALQPSPNGGASAECVVPCFGDDNEVDVVFTLELL